MPAGIGDHEAVERVIGDRAHQRIVGGAVGEAEDAGREREQREHPDHRQHGQQRQDIRLGVGAPERHERHGGRDDRARDQQHQQDAAAPPRRLLRSTCGESMSGSGGHGIRRDLSQRCAESRVRRVLSA